MRKIIALLLAGCMLFSLAACGGTSAQSPAENTEVAEAPAAEDLTGVYKNITFSPDTTYQLNENTTYFNTTIVAPRPPSDGPALVLDFT